MDFVGSYIQRQFLCFYLQSGKVTQKNKLDATMIY